MTNENSIKLVAYQDINLPKRSMLVSSKVYSIICKDNKPLLTRFPVIGTKSILDDDINIIESSILNDEICGLSPDIFISIGCDVSGDIINVISAS